MTETYKQYSGGIEDMKHLLADPFEFINQEIGGLKDQVREKSEQLKLEIDSETKDLLTKLDEYQNRCENSSKQTCTSFEQKQLNFFQLNL